MVSFGILESRNLGLVLCSASELRFLEVPSCAFVSNLRTSEPQSPKVCFGVLFRSSEPQNPRVPSFFMFLSRDPETSES